ncbi:MAG: hypothetical protein AAB417_03545 [Patescibacteria group bacterium]
MDYKDAKKRLEAAHALFVGDTTSREKFSAVRDLVGGMHAGIDEKLKACDEAFSHLDKLDNGEYSELAAEHLPDDTEDRKGRKRALLLLIQFWKNLRSEISRVEAELYANEIGQKVPNQKSVWSKIFGAAKGPFGLITIVAVGAAVVLQATSVSMTIKNNGCGPMIPGSLPIPLPGLKLPGEPIASGGSAVATLPAVTVTIDGTQPGAIYLRALKLDLSFQIPNNIKDVTLNGQTLLKKTTQVALGAQKNHEIVFVCK